MIRKIGSGGDVVIVKGPKNAITETARRKIREEVLNVNSWSGAQA